MTNQEINEAIAKECGWEFVDIAAAAAEAILAHPLKIRRGAVLL